MHDNSLQVLLLLPMRLIPRFFQFTNILLYSYMHDCSRIYQPEHHIICDGLDGLYTCVDDAFFINTHFLYGWQWKALMIFAST